MGSCRFLEVLLGGPGPVASANTCCTVLELSLLYHSSWGSQPPYERTGAVVGRPDEVLGVVGRGRPLPPIAGLLGLATTSSFGAASGAAATGSSTCTPTAAKVTPSSSSRTASVAVDILHRDGVHNRKSSQAGRKKGTINQRTPVPVFFFLLFFSFVSFLLGAASEHSYHESAARRSNSSPARLARAPPGLRLSSSRAWLVRT